MGRTPLSNGLPRNPVIVLTGDELFSEHGIGEAWKKIGGKAASLVKGYTDFSDLRELSEMTQFLYLSLPWPWEEARALAQ